MRLRKKFNRLLAMILSICIIATMIPTNALAVTKDPEKNQVHVIVENTTYKKAEGAKWDGTLVDTWVNIDENSTAMSCINSAVTEAGYSGTGLDGSYISEINGVSASESGAMSGWMGTLNDWFTNEGFDAFKVSNGKLEADDEIKVMYSCDGGEDLGGSWNNNSTALKSVIFSVGQLDKTFAPETTEYKLTLPVGTESIKVTPTADNKNFQVHTRIGETTYRRSQDIPVTEETVIKITCGDGVSMNSGATPTVYTFTVAYKQAPTSTLNAAFDKTTATVFKGDSLTLNLKENLENSETRNIAGATILINDNATDKVTDGNGNVTLSFDEKGTYNIGAEITADNTATTAECTVEVIEVVSSGKSGKIEYRITSDGIAYLNAAEGTDGKMATYGMWNAAPWNGVNVKKVVINEGVTTIGDYAFNGSMATEIVIPGTVTSIGQYAFCKCSKIDELVIPEGVTTIKANAFADMSVRKLTFPSSFTTLSGAIFNTNTKISELVAAEGCAVSISEKLVLGDSGKNVLLLLDKENYSGEVVIPEGITSINTGVFAGSKITKVTVPSSITKLEANAFNGCTLLKEAVVGCNTSQNGIFSGCTALTKVTFKEGVTTLTGKCFDGCTALETIELPKSLETITGNVIMTCTGLKNIVLAEDGIFKLKDNMLIKNETEISLSITSAITGELVIPEGIKTIGDAAFSGAEITSVKFADTVEELGEDAFYNCKNLKTVTFGTSDKLTTIGAYAFQATAIESIVIPNSVVKMEKYVFGECASLKSVTLPDTLTDVGEKQFIKCTSLEEAVLPCSALTSMFEGCTALKKVTFKEGATEIGSNAFKGCTALETVNLAASIETINSTAFSGCTAIKNIVIPDGSSWKAVNGLLIKDNVVYMALCIEADVVIPEGVTQIADGAFQNNTIINTVKLPSTLESIGKYAFKKSSLTKVTIPGSVKTMGTQVFDNSKIKEAVLEKGAVLSEYMFSQCADLTKVVLPEGLTEIPSNCFYRCQRLTEIDIPDTVVTLGTSCLRETGITDIELPEGLTSLGNQVFYKTSIGSIVIPEGVKNIGTWMFANTTSLRILDIRGAETINNPLYAGNCEVIYLPASLKSIKETFLNYNKLKAVFFGGTKEEWDSIAGIDTVKTNLENQGTVVVYNYNGTDTGEKLSITKQPVGATVTVGLRAPELSVETDAPEGAVVLYNWYENGKLKAKYTNIDTINPASDKVGENEYYCQILSVKDGKVSIATTDKVKVTVQEHEGEFFKGEGTEENPFLIENAEDIDNFSALVGNGQSYEGKYFKLTDDIVLPDNWIPVGCTKDGSNDIKSGTNMNAFSGTFDGAGHKVTVPKGEKPLFSYVYGATIKNLDIYGEEIDGYGLINNMEGVGLSGTAVTIDNVTLKSGSKTKKSGFVGGVITTNGFSAVSAGYVTIIKNSTIEKDVIVGYDGEQDKIGSFAGMFQGSIENCVSYATVKGKSSVGGIIGSRDNVMGRCEVKNCTFGGEVISTVTDAGGIAGRVYSNSTAPNGVRISITDCVVTGNVQGKNNVGGILGADSYTAQVWNEYHFTNNTFKGKISGEKNVGSIIGYYYSLNKFDDIAGNTYAKDCGATSPFGAVALVDTNCANPTAIEGTLYFSTETDTSNCPTVTGCAWKTAHNRTDDPLGADIEKLAAPIKEEKPVDTEALKTKVNAVLKSTAGYMSDLTAKYDATAGVTGGEWWVIGLSRSDTAPKNASFYKIYLDSVTKYVEENILDGERLHKVKSSDNSRIILGLTAIGADPTNIAGHNLVAGLNSMSYVKKQGMNGPIWALIALDSNKYEIPANANQEDAVTRDKLIDEILAARLEDGGWDFSKVKADPDMTGMALQALAPYYNERSDVKEAVDKAVEVLSKIQNEDGGFSTWGSPTSESASQVIVALTALGIDPAKDARFIKNGNTVLDALCDYAVEGGGFKHIADGDLNGMATEQGFYALAAYYRFVNDKTSLYDMTDVKKYEEPKDNPDDKPEEKPEEKPEDKPADKPVVDTVTEEKIENIVEKVDAIISEEAAGVSEEELVDSVIEATKAYENLSDEEKALVSDEVKEKIAKAQEKAGEINHKSGDVKVEGIKWNFKVTAKPVETITVETRALRKSAENNLKDGTVLLTYDISLTDVLSNTKVEPGEDGITITMPIPDEAKDYDHIIVAHLRADGVIEYVKAQKADGMITFKLASLSPVAIVGYNGTEVKANFNDTTTAPKTNDLNGFNAFAYAGLMILCVGTVVVALSKRRTNKL